jgi:ubiquinone/menaquinone biosynthesis C-methylase UbiE
MSELFDDWPEKYDHWFETPIGRLIKDYESELSLKMLKPGPAELILDAGCGTGVFTADILEAGSNVVGLELAFNMLWVAQKRFSGQPFRPIQADMLSLPFANQSFDKSISITAIEFIEDAKAAVDELFRVTKPGGVIVVATLNVLGPWAKRRQQAAKNGHPLFRQTIFRSPEELRNLSPIPGAIETAIHFEKNADPKTAQHIESSGQEMRLDTGAFVVARWIKSK